MSKKKRISKVVRRWIKELIFITALIKAWLEELVGLLREIGELFTTINL